MMHSRFLPLFLTPLLVHASISFGNFTASTTSTTLTLCTGYTTIVVPIDVPTSVSACTTTSTSTSTSITSTPTPTPSGSCLVNPLCQPLGLNIDYYTNDLAAYSRQNSGVLSNYYIVDSLTPLSSSLTNTTYFPTNQGQTTGAVSYPNTSLPATATYASFANYNRVTNGGITVDANNFTLVYHGFYHAPATGAYEICTQADNENDVYFGDGNAVNCADGTTGTAADPVLTSGFDLTATPCTTVNLVQGAYYPIRSVMGNWQGPSALNLTIKAPGASVSSSTFTGLLYPQSCAVSL